MLAGLYRLLMTSTVSCCLAAVTVLQSWGMSLEETVRDFSGDRSALRSLYAGTWSDAYHHRMQAMARSWQERLSAIDFDKLSQEDKIDLVLLDEEQRYALAWHALELRRLAEITELVPGRNTVEQLCLDGNRMGPIDPATAAKTVATLPEQIQAIEKRLRAGLKAKEDDATSPDALKVKPLLAFRAAKVVSGMLKSLNDWYEAYAGSQPDFAWWVKEPMDETRKKLDAYAKFLREEIAHVKGKPDDPLIGEALGADGLKADIAAEILSYSPQDMLAIGEKEFEWCEEQMRIAAKEMGHDDWHAALKEVKSKFVPPGQQGDYIVEQALRATAFVKERDLVTVPPLCEETWRLTMISSEKQRQLPYVAYNSYNMLAAYARDDMSHGDKLMSMRGNNLHFTRLTTAHELIPGHHLQRYFEHRYRSYRSIFSTPFYVEGWALYWEMLLWDQKFAEKPEDRIGMLFWRMHRAARIIVTIKFHLGDMTPKEMIAFLVERVGHEEFGATSEVRRFIAGDFSPLYQCSYMIGGLHLRALAKEAAAAGISTKQFNDAVLKTGPIPIALVRASILGTPLTRDGANSWRIIP